jgi:RNA polymerase sigma-70 factor, ECF subfamily
VTPDAVAAAWRQHRQHVLDVAFRMLGDLGEAEDVTQEAYLRLSRAEPGGIDDPGGWLVVVASRLCLDRLRARRRRPADPADDLDARRAPEAADPADRVTLDDHVGLAFRLVLERLTPAERTAFVLHDVFGYPFDEIAAIVGRTPQACRQLASRARRTVRGDAAAGRFTVEPAEQRELTERFVRAAATGDLDGLLAVLDPDVSGWSDGGIPPTVGAAAVAAGVLRYLGPPASPTLVSVPADVGAGIVVARGGRVLALVLLTFDGPAVTRIDALTSPGVRDAVGRMVGLA